MVLAKNEFIENKINNKFLKSATIMLLFILLYGVNNTYIYYASLIPFGISIVFSLLFVGFNGYVLGFVYLASLLLGGVDIPLLLQGFNVLGVLSLLQYLLSKGKLSLKKWQLFLFLLSSLISFVVFNVGGTKENLALFVSIVLSVFFLYSCLVFLDATIGKCLLGKVNLDEKICGCVILIIFSVGISGCNVSIINLGLLFGTLVLLIVNKLCSSNVSIMCGVLIGIGSAIYYVNSIYISLFVVMVVGAVAFKCNWKILSAIAVSLVYVLFVLMFGLGFVLGECLSVLLGACVYLCIPKKILQQFSGIFVRTKQVAISNIFNSGKKEVVERIKELSIVFSEMDKVYRDMVKGGLEPQEAKGLIKDELVAGVCSKCSNFARCFRDGSSFMSQCVENIVSVGYDKGKLSLIDLPEYLTTNCYCVGQIVQYFNNLISAYMEYKTAVNNIDTSRVLIAEQLGGVSRLLEVLSSEVDINVSLGNPIEEVLKERLNYAGIICLECVVYEKDINNKAIQLIVANKQYNDSKLLKIVNKSLKSKYFIVSSELSQVAGAITLVLKNKPNYDIVFGSSFVTKNGKVECGDNHLVTRVNDGKYMVSICDGMGSGKEASRISKLTISLIENFYRAGFDNETILSSVNKILSLNESENFSTIDLCIIDARKNIYDFVKLGASNGYIKRANNEVEVVSSSGLPVGVIENITPHITKLRVSNMDMVILVSDGVSDALGDSIQSLLINLDTINPQLLSEQILNKALEVNNGVSLDDMTVVCVRVFESV